MKKSNVIVFVLLAIVSAFLLWLWYFLGLNVIDEPLDLVLSIAWWVVIVAAIAVIVKMEQVRRQRVRTVYVGGRSTFNSEKGLMNFDGGKPMQEVIASILENLKYDFTREEFPEKDKFEVKYFVRTKEFAVEKQEDAVSGQASADEDASAQEQAPEEISAPDPVSQDVAVQADAAASPEAEEQKKWTGEVVIVKSKEERPFASPEELAGILASLEKEAA